MGEQLSEANRALIGEHGGTPGLNWAEEYPSTLNRLLNAARSEGPHPESGEWSPTHRHIGRGTDYEVIGSALIQLSADVLIEDDEEVTVYRGEDGRLWVRPASEFYDGRFVELPAALSLPRPASDKGKEEPVAWVVFATGECCKGGRKIDISRAEVEQYGREIYGKFDVQPLYARPSPGVSREEVAREVNPTAWKLHDEIQRVAALPDQPRDFATMKAHCAAQTGGSLERATRILALLSRGEG